jgi:hypothetical protein
MKLKSDELADLARREHHNVAVLSQIQDEMAHRGKHPAADAVRKLVSDLTQESVTGQKPCKREARRAKHIKQDPPALAPPASEARAAADGAGAALRDYKARYEVLRETFTAEAELLARWGMTPSMPTEMRREVFTSWRRWLSRREHPHGMTVSDLDADMTTLDPQPTRSERDG